MKKEMINSIVNARIDEMSLSDKCNYILNTLRKKYKKYTKRKLMEICRIRKLVI